MDEETPLAPHLAVQQLILSLRQIYSATTTQEVKAAEFSINKHLSSSPLVVIGLLEFLRPPFNSDKNFRLAVATLIKKQFYKLAEDERLNKSNHIQALYDILTCTNYEQPNVKELLGSALEYILNKDNRELYKPALINTAIARLEELIREPENWTLASSETLYGLGIVFIAYMNSLVETEDLLSFILRVLQPLCLTANISLHFATSNIDSTVSLKAMLQGSKKVFQLLEISIERLMDEEDMLGEDIEKLKNSDMLNNVILEYLFAENNDNSIISRHPALNEIKHSIMEILTVLNAFESPIPKSIINTLLYTYLKEATAASILSRQDEDDDYSDQIICRVMEILESHLESKRNYSLFLQYKVNILFATLMFSRTSPSEEQNCYEEPERFSQVAEEYSESFSHSNVLKVRAASLLRAFVRNIDEGANNLVELILIFITSSLSADPTDSEVVANIKREFGNNDFFGLPNREKLDVSFMALTVISPLIQDSVELLGVIYGILVSQCSTLCQFTDQLLVCRLMRLVGYFPLSQYFKFMEERMGEQRVYLIEGTLAFEKIIKNVEYLKNFPLMHRVFLGVVDLIKVSDSLFEQLTLNHYTDILCENEELYIKVMDKLRTAFIEAAGGPGVEQNKHISIICLNYLDKFIKRERREKYNNFLLEVFSQVEAVASGVEILSENFISLYHTIVVKFLVVDRKVEEFAVKHSHPSYMLGLSHNTEFFPFINKLICKVDDPSTIEALSANLQSFLLMSRNEHFNSRLICPLSFTIGQILVSHLGLNVGEQTVQFVLGWVLTGKQEEQNYEWIMFLSLHLVFLKPALVREYLMQGDQYFSFMVNVFKAKMKTKLERKVAVLSMLQLLKHEPDQPLVKEIIKFCIRILEEQREKYTSKPTYNVRQRVKLDATMRRAMNMKASSPPQEERMQNEQEQKDNNDAFSGMKHTMDRYDEFESFKRTLQGMQWRELVSPSDIDRLAKIFESEWVQGKVRRIVKVKGREEM